MLKVVMFCALTGSAAWSFCELYQAGYRRGLQVVWTVETLGRCDLETGKILP